MSKSSSYRCRRRTALARLRSDPELVEQVEGVLREVDAPELVETGLRRQLARSLLAHAGAGALAADRQRLRHAVIGRRGVAERADPHRVVDVLLQVAEEVELKH